MFDAALRTAEELDKSYEDTGIVKGPLHGLPISLKDQFHVKGYDTSMGYVGWIGTYEGDEDPAKVHKVNSQIVRELLSLGAVLYCKVVLLQCPLFAKAEVALSDQSTTNPLGMLVNTPLDRTSTCIPINMSIRSLERRSTTSLAQL